MNSDAGGKWAKPALISAAGVAVLTFMIATATESPRPALAILQYALLAAALIGLAGSTAMYLSSK